MRYEKKKMVVNIDYLDLCFYKVADGHTITKKDPITLAKLNNTGVATEILNSCDGTFPRVKLVERDRECFRDVFLYYCEDDYEYLGTCYFQKWDIRLCNFRIEDSLFYTKDFARDTNFYRILLFAIENTGFQFKHITRCDICADFEPKKNKICTCYDDPHFFIRDVLMDDVVRVSRGAKRATLSPKKEIPHYEKSGSKFTYLRFSNHLPTIALYNKTHEMKVKVMKPFIVDSWRANGLDDSGGDVWRCEWRFGFKASYYSEQIVSKVHTILSSDRCPLNCLIAIINENIKTRLRFRFKKSLKLYPIFSPIEFGVTDCNLTEYKLSEKLPRVSSYHIGICKFIRRFSSDLRVTNLDDETRKALRVSADYLLEQCHELFVYRNGADLFKIIEEIPNFDGRDMLQMIRDKSLPKYYDELSILAREIKEAKKVRRIADKELTTKIVNYKAVLRAFSFEEKAVSPVK